MSYRITIEDLATGNRMEMAASAEAVVGLMFKVSSVASGWVGETIEPSADAVPAAARTSVRERIAAKRKAGGGGKGCELCGSNGRKHKKGCVRSYAAKDGAAEPVAAPKKGEARVQNGRAIFSEATYDKVRKWLETKNENRAEARPYSS